MTSRCFLETRRPRKFYSICCIYIYPFYGLSSLRRRGPQLCLCFLLHLPIYSLPLSYRPLPPSVSRILVPSPGGACICISSLLVVLRVSYLDPCMCLDRRFSSEDIYASLSFFLREGVRSSRGYREKELSFVQWLSAYIPLLYPLLKGYLHRIPPASSSFHSVHFFLYIPCLFVLLGMICTR